MVVLSDIQMVVNLVVTLAALRVVLRAEKMVGQLVAYLADHWVAAKAAM